MSGIPERMRCVVVRRHGSFDALEIEERAVPRPKAGEALLRVRAASINHLDTWVRRGIEGVTFPLPIVPGCDAAGVVAERGPGVTNVNPGDEVVLSPGTSCGHCVACASGREPLCRRYGIIGEHSDGTDAEYAVFPAANLLPKPANLSFEEAAAVPLVFLTAWHMLVARAEVRPGETVLVHAAGSGVSTAAIQIARLFGARVLVTAGSDAKIEKARALGAEAGVNYRAADFLSEVRRLTGKRGVDVVIDHVGTDTFEKSVRSLASGGRVVTCGGSSGPAITLDVRPIFFKSLSILGSTMGSRGELLEVLSHVAAGRLRPVVDSTFPLADVVAAHRRVAERDVFGKIVLIP